MSANKQALGDKQPLELKLENEVGKEIKINDKLGYGEDLSADYTVVLDYVSKLKAGFSVKIGGDYLTQVLDEFVKAQYEREKPVIQGFSQSKIPPLVVLKDHYIAKFKKGTYQTVKNLFDYVLITEIRRAVDFVKDKYGLKDTLDPKFDHLDVRNGANEPEKTNFKFDDYSFKFSIESLPALPEIDLTKLSVECPKAKITDADVKKAMEEWAAANSRGVDLKADRPVQLGDTVKVDLSIPGKKDTLDNFQVVVGGGKLNPEFEHNLIGKSVGEKFSYNFGLPKDFPDASVAGRSFNITVTVKQVQSTEHYKIDEEMARVFQCASVAACEEKFRATLEEQAEKLHLFASRFNLESVLAASFDIAVPEEIFDESMLKRLDRLAKEIGVNLHYPMPDEEKEAIKDKMLAKFGYEYDHWHKLESDSVKADLRASLQIVDYAKKQNITLSPAEIDSRIASYAAGFQGGLKEAVAFFEKDPKAKQNIAREVLDEKIISEMLRKVKVKQSEVSLEELRKIVAKGNRVNIALEANDTVKTKKVSTSEKKTDTEANTDSKTDSKPASKAKSKE